ncbi:MAG: 50S ribosomal protein L18 [Candidatus Buchananbacteria bacterium RBG_13_36_9]|uniref:Large ribosomal subunit protein uL18 n=1 Tax=Candidatus Buchananbacteria bacterium RBG_13_36_9 TaxID=1797530 RepID=A0A1G1XMK0_9BACT|nr:MAG: 50S ribosomal protein L18 [Candidatus Buchananbacteria bacterium RBG_13_36_9]
MKDKSKIKKQTKEARRKRIRAKVKGTAARPRLNVFRSLKHIYAQLINDQNGKTLVSASDLELKNKKAVKTDQAKEVGKLIAGKAKDHKIKKVVFDRAGYKFHGRVKAVADGAKEGGLEF